VKDPRSATTTNPKDRRSATAKESLSHFPGIVQPCASVAGGMCDSCRCIVMDGRAYLGPNLDQTPRCGLNRARALNWAAENIWMHMAATERIAVAIPAASRLKQSAGSSALL
jgi:hypothetical protein